MDMACGMNGRDQNTYFQPEKIKEKRPLDEGSQTFRFWMDGTDFESCLLCPAWIYGGSYTDTTFLSSGLH
jgi:hypothetical protein